MGTCGACPEPIGLAALEYSNKRASSAHSSNRPSNPYSATLVIGAGTVGSKLTDASGFARDIAGLPLLLRNACTPMVSILYLSCQTLVMAARDRSSDAMSSSRGCSRTCRGWDRCGPIRHDPGR